MFNTHVAGQKIKQTAKEGGEIPNWIDFVLHSIKIVWFKQNETDW